MDQDLNIYKKEMRRLIGRARTLHEAASTGNEQTIEGLFREKSRFIPAERVEELVEDADWIKSGYIDAASDLWTAMHDYASVAEPDSELDELYMKAQRLNMELHQNASRDEIEIPDFDAAVDSIIGSIGYTSAEGSAKITKDGTEFRL